MSSYSPRFPNAPSQYDATNEAQFRAALRAALQDTASPLGTTLDLNDLTDVNVPGPSDDDVLGWSTDRWVAVSQLAATQISEAAVTQHEAALAIAASQVTPGTFDDGLYTFSRSVLNEIIRLVQGTATGNPAITFYQDTNRRAFIEWNNNSQLFVLENEQGGGVAITGPSARLRIAGDSGTASPRIDFYQGHITGTRRAYIEFNDGVGALRIVNEETGLVQMLGGRLRVNPQTGSGDLDVFDGRDSGSASDFGDRLVALGREFDDPNRLVRFGYSPGGTFGQSPEFVVEVGATRRVRMGSGPFQLIGKTGELLRLVDSSTTGDPQLTFYQDGTRAGYIQYHDSRNNLELIPDLNSGGVLLWTKDSGGTHKKMVTVSPGDPHVILNENAHSGDEILRLVGTSSGSPRLTMYQASSQRAYIQYQTSGDHLRIAAVRGVSDVEIYTGNALAATFENNKDLTVEGDVIATV